MVGTTYAKFFWQDFQADDELRMCSLGAQGLWMRYLCLAARAVPIGHVLVSGRKPNPSDVRRVTGCVETDDQIVAYEKELVDSGVCNTTREGVLVSRRLVRDARRRSISVEGGKARQKQITETTAKNGIGSSRSVQQGDSATIYHQPESISHQPSAKDTAAKDASDFQKIVEALGIDPTTSKNGWRWIDQLIRLKSQDGLDVELDLLPVILAAKSENRIPRDLGGPAYFRKAALEHRQGRAAMEAIETARANAPVEQTDEKGWHFRLERWLDSGYWPPQWGPRPRSGACLAPPTMLAGALKVWQAQGNHPQGGFPADPNGRYLPWDQLRNVRSDPHVDYGERPWPGDNVVSLSSRAAG